MSCPCNTDHRLRRVDNRLQCTHRYWLFPGPYNCVWTCGPPSIHLRWMKFDISGQILIRMMFMMILMVIGNYLPRTKTSLSMKICAWGRREEETLRFVNSHSRFALASLRNHAENGAPVEKTGQLLYDIWGWVWYEELYRGGCHKSNPWSAYLFIP